MCKRMIATLLTLVLVFSCFPVIAFAADNPKATLTVPYIYTTPGSTVSVDIEIEGNPGILGAALSVSWSEGLTLVDCANGSAFSELTFQAPSRYISGCNFVWYGSSITEAVDGAILTLTFEVTESAADADSYAIEVSYDSRDVLDENYNTVDLTVVNGGVRIVTYKPGDVTGDDRVNLLDLVKLCQFISDGCKTDPDGFNISINESAADVNDDGRINPLDMVLISRFISDGCVTDPNGYNVELKPSTPKCVHSMQATAGKEATCTQDGNVAYWYCSKCEKYFSNEAGTAEIDLADTVIPSKGHTVVIDPAKEPTKTETGLTEGSHCSVCNEVIVAQEVLPTLTGYAITYNIATGDSNSYIAAQGLGQTISTEKRQYFSDEGLAELPALSLPGYEFLGWFTAPPENSNAVQVTEIPAGSTGNYTLYAHWHEYTYDITYKLYQTPLGAITDEKYLHYTVSKGLVDLPNPELYNYVFMGWYTDDGEEVTQIPAGQTEDITLNAYWTSKRNLTKAVKNLDDPIVIENSDDGVIYFTYEIGTIENVPLSDAIWTIQSVAGLAQQKSETVSTTISEEKASTIAETISQTTVDSATWTLSSDWNEVTEVSEEWAESNEMTQEEANTITKSSSGTYSFTDSKGGADTKTITDGTTTVDYNSQNYTHGNSAEFNIKVSGSYSNEGNLSSKVAGTYEVSADVSGGYKQSQETNEHTGTDTTKVNTAVEAENDTWNKTESKSTTHSASESVSVKNAMSQIISNTKGYGKSYATGGENSESQGFSSTDSKSANASSTLTYFTSETKTTTTTYSTDGKSEGCYRLVIAGTVHVFAVVGYDVATRSYFAYTFNVLDDKTYEFLDYSPTLSFNDYENGALPFEIPFFVHEYVTEKTVITTGIQFKTNTTDGTATVIGYTGTETDVTIPSYVTSGNVAYKVTGISANAFAGKNIRSVVLSDYITELPDGAFKNCTQLEEISGYFTKIGAEAFSGCTALKKYNIASSITQIGENAFAGVNAIYVNAIDAENALKEAKNQNSGLGSDELLANARAITQDAVNAAVNSGAQNVTLNISKITDGTVLTLDVPGISSFELDGGLKEYKDLKLTSKAATTTLKNITVSQSTRIPLEISSNTLNLNAVSIEASGFVLLLSANAPTISLTRDSRLISKEKKAVVWNDPTIVSKVVENAVGTLDITGNVYTYGSITGIEYISITDGSVFYISQSEFDNYIKGVYTITFDANGGEMEATDITIFYGSAFGTLPTPTRAHYTFDGWFTEDGTEVTSDTIMTESKDITLTARWSLVPYTASWDTGTGYTISVNRTSSPNAGASIGTLNNGATVYYGDELSVTYTASTGYSLDSKGSTSITVTGNVTNEQIYTSASTNSYTYNIVYKSSNGTALGSSTATYKYGTTNTISAPTKSGYTTPSSQTVVWDSTSAKTITFVYTPTAVSTTQKVTSGTWWSNNGTAAITYSTSIEYRNRTASSVQVRVVWTNTIAKSYYYGYSQYFNATVGGVSTGTVTIASSSLWSSSSTSARSQTVYSDWITVSLSTTNQTTVSISGNWWSGSNSKTSWSGNFKLPAY